METQGSFGDLGVTVIDGKVYIAGFGCIGDLAGSHADGPSGTITFTNGRVHSVKPKSGVGWGLIGVGMANNRKVRIMQDAVRYNALARSSDCD